MNSVRIMLLNRNVDIKVKLMMSKPKTSSADDISVPPVSKNGREIRMQWENSHYRSTSRRIPCTFHINSKNDGAGTIEYEYDSDITDAQVGSSCRSNDDKHATIVSLSRDEGAEDKKKGLKEDGDGDEEEDKFEVSKCLSLRADSDSYSSKSIGCLTDVSDACNKITELENRITDDNSFEFEDLITVPTGETDDAGEQILKKVPPKIKVKAYPCTIEVYTIPEDMQCHNSLDGQVMLSKEDRLIDVLNTLTSMEKTVKKTVEDSETDWKPRTKIAEIGKERLESHVREENAKSDKGEEMLEKIDKTTRKVAKRINDSMKAYILDEKLDDARKIVASIFMTFYTSPFMDGNNSELTVLEVARLTADTVKGGAQMDSLDGKIVKALVPSLTDVRSHFKVAGK